MKLEKYKEEAQFFTDKLSEINRYLGLAGIGVIWIFKFTIDNKIAIPQALYLPLILLVISLLIDFLQYLYGSTVWTIFFRYHENQKRKSPKKKIYKQDDIKAPKVLPNISYVFFYSKIILTILGYGFIISYLLNSINK